MKVYRPAASWEDDWRVHVPSCTVIEVEPAAPRFSGLYDQHGNRLMVVEERAPAGFVNFTQGKPRDDRA